jgi:RNA polymerase sigma factor (sigma-70 family)
VEASAIHAPGGLGRISASGPLLRFRSDDQLVALFRMGYEEAFRVIHDRYRQRLFAYTRQMLGGSRSDAEDALQDTFMRAYGALRQDDRPVTLRAWLYRVAHNRCIDQLRRPAPPASDLFELSRSPLQDPMAAAERREDLRRLVEDVARLPEQQRSALLMRELEGLTYAELADALGVTVPAVKSLLVRARIGLVEASEARDTACMEIRAELDHARHRGVRSSGRTRRHLRDCAGCREYKQAMRTVRDGLGALSPATGPLATLAKLLGLGGASSGAAAGGGAAAAAGAGGGAAVAGGGAAAATATKVAAIVCCAAVVGGGAAEVRHEIVPRTKRPAPKAAAHPARTWQAPARVVAVAPARTAPAVVTHRAAAGSAAAKRKAAARDKTAKDAAAVHQADPTATTTTADPATASAPTPDEVRTGGSMAPDENALPGDPATTQAGADTSSPKDSQAATGAQGSAPADGWPAGQAATDGTTTAPSGAATREGSWSVAQGASVAPGR